MDPLYIPGVVVRRLPICLRALSFMADEGRKITSSQELGARLHLSAAQIRKDLSYFGEFGKQGTGYEIDHLREQLLKILHVDRAWPLALIGAGDLGQAIMHYEDLVDRGFCVAAVFDNNPRKVGKKLGDQEILDIPSLPKTIRRKKIQIAIIAVPASAAQEVTDILVKAGIKAILNYAPIVLSVPEDVNVYDIDPVAGLQSMTYYL